jgi:hypothetical protein
LPRPKPVDLDQLVIDENNVYDPDDEEEESEERRKLEEQRILRERRIRIWEEEVLEPIMEKSMEEVYEIMRQLFLFLQTCVYHYNVGDNQNC